jgi:hypothetical protein
MSAIPAIATELLHYGNRLNAGITTARCAEADSQAISVHPPPGRTDPLIDQDQRRSS